MQDTKINKVKSPKFKKNTKIIVVGNPAIQISWVSEYGHRLEFDNKGFSVCPESSEKYKLENNEVIKL